MSIISASIILIYSMVNFQYHLDEITIFYGVLRSASNPEAEYHHSSMCDQRIFTEALRILDRPDLLVKIIEAYHNIKFT